VRSQPLEFRADSLASPTLRDLLARMLDKVLLLFPRDMRTTRSHAPLKVVVALTYHSTQSQHRNHAKWRFGFPVHTAAAHVRGCLAKSVIVRSPVHLHNLAGPRDLTAAQGRHGAPRSDLRWHHAAAHCTEFITFGFSNLFVRSLSNMVAQDPRTRIPLKAVMAHPWVTCGGAAAMRTVRDMMDEAAPAGPTVLLPTSYCCPASPAPKLQFGHRIGSAALQHLVKDYQESRRIENKQFAIW